MQWCRIDLPDDDKLPERLQRLVQTFDALFAAAGYPRGMDLMIGRRTGKRVTVYLTPEATRFAYELVSAYRGRACERPRHSEVAVLDGFEADRRRLCR